MYIVVIIMFLILPLIIWKFYNNWEKEKNEKVVEDYKQTIKKHIQTISNLKAKISQNSNAQNSLIGTLQNKCNALQNKCDALSNELSNYERIKSQQDSKISKLQSKLNDLESCSESKDHQIKVLSGSLNLCNKEKLGLENKLNHETADAKNLHTQFDKLNVENTESKNTIISLKSDLKKAISENVATEERAVKATENFKAQINALNVSLEKLQTKNEELTGRLRQEENKSKELRNKFNGIENACSSRDLRIRELESALSKANEEIDRQKHEIEELSVSSYNGSNYNILNKHKRDANVQFDEDSHTYTIHGREFVSVTDFVDRQFPKFDRNSIARMIARKQCKSVNDVLKEWDYQRDLGTYMHANIEKFFLGEKYEVNDVFQQFLDFAEKVHLSPYRTEWAIYDEESGLAGTLDFLDCQNGEFVLYDWKRSKNVVTPKGKLKDEKAENGYGVMSRYKDNSYNHYTLQTSIYRYILEKNYGIMVKKSCLVVMHPTIDQAYLVEVPYLREEVEALLSKRS